MWVQGLRKKRRIVTAIYVAIGVLSAGAGVYTYVYGRKPATMAITATNQNSPGGVAIGKNDGVINVGTSDANQTAEIVRAVKEVGERTEQNIIESLRKELGHVRRDGTEGLARRFPMGCALVAFSGEHKVVVPPRGGLIVDWDTVKISMYGPSDVNIVIPTVYDAFNNVSSNNYVRVSAIPGAASIGAYGFSSWVLRAECLRVTPIGICVAVGFVDRPARKR
jgi:hypothetical protein